PSNVKGVVMIATVKIPISLAALANTGLAPVPVPPPIPAVIKSILVLVPNILLISSILSIAEFSPTSGSAPAPIPSVRLTPNCTLLGIGLNSNACASVLHTIKSTPLIPCLYMWLTALPPPPPTPITLIIEDCSFNISNCIDIIYPYLTYNEHDTEVRQAHYM